jgi:hypothetical protein
MKNVLIFLSGLIVAFVILIVHVNVKDKKNEDTIITNCQHEIQINSDSVNLQFVRVMHAPKSVFFADEEVPLHYFDVRESLERELNQIAYSHHATLLTIRLSGRYFGVIDSILREQGVPSDFKYLCVAESNLQNAISSAKAVGFWQFMPETGKQYGLEINDEIDERYNFEKSTIAACRYLKDAYRKYDNWELAAAAYNMGTANLTKVVENQKSNNYYDLMLNPETARYLYRILAYKIILNNPEWYGFYISENEKYNPLKFYEITVNDKIDNIADFAKKHGTNYKMIKILNPWLRKHALTNKAKKSYKIKIPAKNFRYEE